MDETSPHKSSQTLSAPQKVFHWVHREPMVAGVSLCAVQGAVALHTIWGPQQGG